MFRLWAKIFKDTRMIKDLTVEDGTEDTRTHKVFNSVEKICAEFDLGKPYDDNFVESIDFDFQEIHIIDED